MSFTIMTDTTANLPDSLVREHGLLLAPLSYITDGAVYTCFELDKFDGKGFYDAMRAKKEVSTSLVNTQLFLDCMEPVLAQGQDLLYVGLSSGISGTFQSAVAAAELLREKYPERSVCLVDSLAASLGEGLQVLRAAQCRKRGMGPEETARLLTETRMRMCQLFTVDDLMFLHRGGRVSRVKALVGTVLHLKPMLTGDREGKIIVYGTARGRKGSLRSLADSYAELVKDAGSQTVAIAHAGSPEDAEYLAKLLRERCEPRDILTVWYEPVTGAHVGPGAVALFFEGDDNARDVKAGPSQRL